VSHRGYALLQGLHSPPFDFLGARFTHPIVQIHHQNGRSTGRTHVEGLQLNLRTETEPERGVNRLRVSIGQFCSTPTGLREQPRLVVFQIRLLAVAQAPLGAPPASGRVGHTGETVFPDHFSEKGSEFELIVVTVVIYN